jgi:folate-binding protein YgfZ
MVADMRVLEVDAASLLDVPAVAHDRLLERLDMFIITEDVLVTDLALLVARLGVHGPEAARVVARLLLGTGEPAGAMELRLAALGEYGSLGARLADGTHPDPGDASDATNSRPAGARQDGTEFLGLGSAATLVVGSREYGVPGFDLFVRAEDAEVLSDRLADSGVPVVDRASEHVLRVEAGRPRFGVDMDEETIPLEAGIEDRAISFTKGCYVGQEVIVRVRDRGHGRVARRLVGLSAVGEPSGVVVEVAPGDTLSVGNTEVGRLTSAAFSPACERIIALGYVHRDSAAAGTVVEARHGDARVPLAVTPTPFVGPA